MNKKDNLGSKNRSRFTSASIWGKSATLFFLLVLLSWSGFAASFKVTGKVKSAADNSPIPGVTIQEKGAKNGTVTGVDGNFTLNVSSPQAVLVLSYIGYHTIEVPVNGKATLDITLAEESESLDQVVVVGYGVQKKKLVTGATVHVQGDDIQKMNTINPIGALQSQTPGINITQSSGLPGQGFKVTIRGLGTVGNSSPLYVIDGIVGGSIDNLNPADIEAIDVLKDAASSAIYGARAANGVVLVTTKQGKSGKWQVTYDGYYGVQNPYKDAPLLNAKEYMTIIDEINFNENQPAFDWANLIPGIYKDIQNGWNGTNWLKEFTNKNAPIQNHALNLVGGSDISKFSFGFGYTNQEGVLGAPVSPYYTRYSARLNSDHVLYKKNGIDIVRFGENLNFSYTQNRGMQIGNIYSNDMHNMLTAIPLMPVYNDNGGFFTYADSKLTGLDDYNSSAYNPIALYSYQQGNQISKNFSVNSNAFIEIQPIKDLIFKSTFGFNLYNGAWRRYVPDYALSIVTTNDKASVEQSMYMDYGLSVENTLTYNFKLNDHAFTAMVGQSAYKSGMGESMSGRNVNYIFDDFEHAYLINTSGLVAGQTSLTGTPSQNGSRDRYNRSYYGPGKLLSYFGRLSYNYKEKYMATAVFRADGSSNFAKGNQWAYYPSVSAGWVVSNESFMENTKSYIDFLKVRASWGENGNCAINPFQYIATISYADAFYSFANSKDSQSQGAWPNILPNKNVKWETSDQLDLGFDARFLSSRLGLQFDWYNKKTKNWLLIADALASFGTNPPYINGGDVENKGVEVGISWNDKIGDFTYGINANMAYNKNNVTRIDNSEGIIHGYDNVLSQGTTEMYRAQVGYPIGYFWGYKTAGVFQNYAQIDEYKKAHGSTLQSNPQPGDLIFVDTNNDKEITSADKTMIGDPNPDYTVGFNINLGYKGFDFALAAAGAFGQQIAKSYRSFADSYMQNYTTDIFGRWYGEGTSNRLPRLTSGTNINWQSISDIYIEDGDYLKIKNLTLGYNFKTLFKRMPLQQLRVYFAIQNVYTFTKYTGMDPEIGYGYGESWVRGIDLGFYPAPRTVMGGVSIRF